MKKNTMNRNNKQPCSQISCMAVFQSGINSLLQIESYAIVNEKNIFSFTGADMHGVTAGNGCARQY